MSIEIIFDKDDVIIDGVSQKTKQVVVPSRASSFIDMEHAPKAASTPITPVPVAGVVDSKDDINSFVKTMSESTEFMTSSALNIMAEDDEAEDKNEEEVIDVKEDETTPVEHVEAEVVDVPDDTAVLNSYSATAEVLADKYKGDLEDLTENENESDGEDTDDDYILAVNSTLFATSIYNKINEIEGAVNALSVKVDNLGTGLKDINDEYTKDAAKINENFGIIEVASKRLKERIVETEYYFGEKLGNLDDNIVRLSYTLATTDIDKKAIIKEAVEKIIPAIFKHLPELIRDQLQESIYQYAGSVEMSITIESEPNVPDDEIPMEDPVVISESDAAAYESSAGDTVEVEPSDDDALLNKYDEEGSIDDEEKVKIIKDAAEKGQLFPWMMKPGDTTPHPEKQVYEGSTFAPQPKKEDSDLGEEEQSFRDYVYDRYAEEDEDDSMTIKTSSVITNNTPAGYYDPAKAARAKKFANKQNKKNNRDNDYNGGGKHNKKNKKHH